MHYMTTEFPGRCERISADSVAVDRAFADHKDVASFSEH